MAEEMKTPSGNEPTSHMSDDTKKKLAEFESKMYREALEAKRAAMPDTSIHGVSGASELDVLENYYPKHDVPIYQSGLNKQIDLVDMEIDKAKRVNRTEGIDRDADLYMKRIRAAVEREAAMSEAEREAEREAKHKKDSRFIYIVPVVILGIAVILGVLSVTLGG